MERAFISKAMFKNSGKKTELDRIDIKFTPVKEKELAGLMKTPFRIYLNKKFIGYAPLDMLAIIPYNPKDPKSKLQIVLKIDKPAKFDKIPFSDKMKIKEFLGKIYKQDNMIEIDKTKDLVVVTKDKTKRRKR